jgi:hypothetical protein
LLHCKKIISCGPVVISGGMVPVCRFLEMSIMQGLFLSAPSAAPLATVYRGAGKPFVRSGRARPAVAEHVYRTDADLRAIGLIDYPSK